MTNLTPIFKFSIHYGSRVISLRLCTSHPFLVWKLPRGRLCFFSVLYFFRRSSFFLSLYFTLFQCISFLSTFLSCALFSCPSIICSYPFIVPPCHVQILTDRIFGMHDLGHPGGHNLYVWILKKTNIHSYKSIFFRVRAISLSFLFTFLSCVFIILWVSFHFLPCSFHFRQSYRYFTFILLKFRSFLSFCFFMSFWCSSDFPFRSSHFPSHLSFMSLSFYSLVTSVSCPFSFKSCLFPSLFSMSELECLNLACLNVW